METLPLSALRVFPVFPVFCVLSVFPVFCSAAPADDLADAAQKLADAPNYAWTATTEMAMMLRVVS